MTRSYDRGRVISVADPTDERIAAYQNVRDRDLLGREGCFMAEGEVVLRTLARSSVAAPVSLLLAKNRVEALADLFDKLPPDCPVYSAPQSVMDKVVGFHIHRGILALGRRLQAPTARDLLAGLPPGRVTVLAVSGVGNHDNMGGLFHNAAAFGADAVLLDSDCCDPLYRKAVRVSVGAALLTPFARLSDGEDLPDLLAGAGIEPLALSPSGEESLSGLVRPERAALLVGAEGPGLPDRVLARCRTVSIPMARGFDSLNVAVAAGIALHALA